MGLGLRPIFAVCPVPCATRRADSSACSSCPCWTVTCYGWSVSQTQSSAGLGVAVSWGGRHVLGTGNPLTAAVLKWTRSVGFPPSAQREQAPDQVLSLHEEEEDSSVLPRSSGQM